MSLAALNYAGWEQQQNGNFATTQQLLTVAATNLGCHSKLWRK